MTLLMIFAMLGLVILMSVVRIARQQTEHYLSPSRRFYKGLYKELLRGEVGVYTSSHEQDKGNLGCSSYVPPSLLTHAKAL